MTSFLLVIVVLILITAIIIIANIYGGHTVKHFYSYPPPALTPTPQHTLTLSLLVTQVSYLF